MSVLVYAESWNGRFRKSTFEAVSYANRTSEILGTDVVAVSLEEVLDDELNKLSGKLIEVFFPIIGVIFFVTFCLFCSVIN